MQVFQQMVEALKVLESHNILHRDIKPLNILISEIDYESVEITTKLADFGIARANTATMTQNNPGTLEYMAPEVLDGEFSAASDVYALGATLYHLASGKTPPKCKVPPKIPGACSQQLRSLVQ